MLTISQWGQNFKTPNCLLWVLLCLVFCFVFEVSPHINTDFPEISENLLFQLCALVCISTILHSLPFEFIPLGCCVAASSKTLGNHQRWCDCHHLRVQRAQWKDWSRPQMWPRYSGRCTWWGRRWESAPHHWQSVKHRYSGRWTWWGRRWESTPYHWQSVKHDHHPFMTHHVGETKTAIQPFHTTPRLTDRIKSGCKRLSISKEMFWICTQTDRWTRLIKYIPYSPFKRCYQRSGAGCVSGRGANWRKVQVYRQHLKT